MVAVREVPEAERSGRWPLLPGAGALRAEDPRLLILSFFFLMLAFALTMPTYGRTPVQLLTALGTCLAFDFVLARLIDKRPILPISGFVTSMGIFLLVDTILVWPYFVTAAISILSKYFIRFNGRHVFTPNNIGILVILYACPDWVALNTARWGGLMIWTSVLFGLGLVISVIANRWVVSVSYVLTFLGGCLLRSMWLGQNLTFISYVIWGPAFQLFTFFMVTDPKTSPRARWAQALFGVSVGVMDNYFRYHENKQASVMALFFTCIGFTAIRVLNSYRRSEPLVFAPRTEAHA